MTDRTINGRQRPQPTPDEAFTLGYNAGLQEAFNAVETKHGLFTEIIELSGKLPDIETLVADQALRDALMDDTQQDAILLGMEIALDEIRKAAHDE